MHIDFELRRDADAQALYRTLAQGRFFLLGADVVTLNRKKVSGNRNNSSSHSSPVACMTELGSSDLFRHIGWQFIRLPEDVCSCSVDMLVQAKLEQPALLEGRIRM